MLSYNVFVLWYDNIYIKIILNIYKQYEILFRLFYKIGRKVTWINQTYSVKLNYRHL